MKKFLVFGLALLLLSSALFADDAKVMPLRTGRLSLAPSFTTGTKAFDAEGTRVDADALKVLNFGAALEFGITSWITGAIQWAPGINVYSDVDTQVPPVNNPYVLSTSKVRLLDVGDLFVGAKIQFIGKEAPIKTDMFRMAFAPGIKIPLPGPDYEKQGKNSIAGDPVTPVNFDNHVLAIGLRSYLDFIINDKFFINLYNESLFNVTKKDFAKAGYEEYMGTVLGGTEGKVSYGYSFTLELEPVFSTPIGGVLFTASIPLTYVMTPGATHEYTTMTVKGNQTQSFSINPGVAFMFYKWAVPFEFAVNYKAPLWGMYTKANHTFIFKAKMFFKI